MKNQTALKPLGFVRRMAILSAFIFLTGAGAQAATITVAAGEVAISANGQCSLREAIINANNNAATHADCTAGSGDDTITLPAGTYTLTDNTSPNEDFSVSGDLDIRSNITVNGAGAGSTFIQASPTAGTATDRVLHVITGTVVVNDVTVRNGRTTNGTNGTNCSTDFGCSMNGGGGSGAPGGGIFNSGTLTLNRVTLTDNQTGNGGIAGNISCSSGFCTTRGGAGGAGAAIFSNGTLTINSGTVSNNQTGTGGAAGTTSCSGGAICNSSTGSNGNGGGALAAATTINATTFSGNNAYDGGAFQQNNGPVTISNSTFTGNSSINSGGAVNCNDGAQTCTITGSAFYGNSVTGGFGGGAIAFFNGGVKNVTNSTISGNTSTVNGGGIRAFGGTINLNFITIANNTADNDSNGSGDGGGIYRDSATVNLKNSIIADNIDTGGQAPDIFGTITSQGYNHVENTTGGTFAVTTGDVTGSDPGLTALANNGGLTQTQAPAYNSPVVDAIPSSTSDCGTTVTTDQRTTFRPTDSNADSTTGCEKGAVELGTLMGGIQAASEPGTYNFAFSAGTVSIKVNDDGTNLDFLRVTEVNVSHPNAPTSIQTGRYWIISPLQSDRTTQATSDYNVDLTLPYSSADQYDRVCRYTGVGTSWDCAVSSYVANTSVTRTGITQLSDWAVQDPIPPTAAPSSISGRLLMHSGMGLKGATVVLTDSLGNTRISRSSSFGYFRFEDLPSGETYIISVISKQFVFTPQVITLNEDLIDFELTATPDTGSRSKTP